MPCWRSACLGEYEQELTAAGSSLKLKPIEKWAFYDAVVTPDHVLTIQTGDQQRYATFCCPLACGWISKWDLGANNNLSPATPALGHDFSGDDAFGLSTEAFKSKRNLPLFAIRVILK